MVAEGTRKSMQANKGKDTGPELKFRKALWEAGLRGYRKNVRKLPGAPDVVFGRAKLAVFVHGCFWHQCPTCSRNLSPKHNSEYWRSKFTANVNRDIKNSEALRHAGYRVHVIWECELNSDVAHIVDQIKAALKAPV